MQTLENKLKKIIGGGKVAEREKILQKYRQMSLRELLEKRLYGDYVSGVIEDVIFEKVEADENHNRHQRTT